MNDPLQDENSIEVAIFRIGEAAGILGRYKKTEPARTAYAYRMMRKIGEAGIAITGQPLPLEGGEKTALEALRYLREHPGSKQAHDVADRLLIAFPGYQAPEPPKLVETPTTTLIQTRIERAIDEMARAWSIRGNDEETRQLRTRARQALEIAIAEMRHHAIVVESERDDARGKAPQPPAFSSYLPAVKAAAAQQCLDDHTGNVAEAAAWWFWMLTEADPRWQKIRVSSGYSALLRKGPSDSIAEVLDIFGPQIKQDRSKA